jgi:hypothetical protein
MIALTLSALTCDIDACVLLSQSSEHDQSARRRERTESRTELSLTRFTELATNYVEWWTGVT